MSYFLEGEESFDSSHFLIGHSGKCKNLHGHRWKIQYGLKADELIESGSSKGMIIDFTDIKNCIIDCDSKMRLNMEVFSRFFYTPFR